MHWLLGLCALLASCSHRAEIDRFFSTVEATNPDANKDCPAGYKKVSSDAGTSACSDIDECEEGLDDCDDDPEACVNEPGRFHCECPDGYFGAGHGPDGCADVDECESAELNDCDADPPACINRMRDKGRYECRCPAGYSGTGVGPDGCIDINECAAMVYPCDTAPKARCVNTAGEFSCICPYGATGGGRGADGCEDIDECARDNGGCDSMTTCTDNPGGVAPQCGSCPRGYVGDGRSGCVPALLGLELGGALSPAFQPTVTSYKMHVRLLVEQITLKATAASSVTIRVNGQDTSNGAQITMPLNLGDNEIDIEINEPDRQQNTYRVLVARGDLEGYLKSSNANRNDLLGSSVALYGDVLAVGAESEASAAQGVDGDANNNDAPNSGAVYVFVRSSESVWRQQAYLKASNTDRDDRFGTSVALYADTLVVGAPGEDSMHTDAYANEQDNSASDSGAVYVFIRSANGAWRQQAYIKAPNAQAGDRYGSSVALDHETLLVGAPGEDSAAVGMNGDETNNDALDSGAAYVVVRSGGWWGLQRYIKASNTRRGDAFGGGVAISGDLIAVGANSEDSAATGVDGDQSDASSIDSGAVYVFVGGDNEWHQQAYLKAGQNQSGSYFGSSLSLYHGTLAVTAPTSSSSGAAYVFAQDGGGWRQQAYLRASNAQGGDFFGCSISLFGDTLVVGAKGEDGAGTGIHGDQASDAVSGSGAAYVFSRRNDQWTQDVYLKASNTDADDYFGHSVAVFEDTVVVAAVTEDSGSTEVNGAQNDNSATDSGAVYVY